MVSYYEDTDKVAYILPMMTQLCDFKKQHSTLPVWEEKLVFNENFNYISDNPRAIIFFEVYLCSFAFPLLLTLVFLILPPPPRPSDPRLSVCRHSRLSVAPRVAGKRVVSCCLGLPASVRRQKRSQRGQEGPPAVVHVTNRSAAYRARLLLPLRLMAPRSTHGLSLHSLRHCQRH